MDNDDLDKILQSLNTELKDSKELAELEQIDNKFMDKIIITYIIMPTFPFIFRWPSHKIPIVHF